MVKEKRTKKTEDLRARDTKKKGEEALKNPQSLYQEPRRVLNDETVVGAAKCSTNRTLRCEECCLCVFQIP